MIRFRVPAILAVAVLLLSGHEAVAQDGSRGRQPGRQEMVRRIQERFQNRLAEELELDREERAFLTEVFAEFGEARAELLPQRRALAAEVSEFMSGDRDDDHAMGLIERLRDLRQQEASLLIEEENRLLEVLRPSQVLQLQSLRDQFGNQIRRLGSPGSRDGRGPRGRPPFPPAR